MDVAAAGFEIHAGLWCSIRSDAKDGEDRIVADVGRLLDRLYVAHDAGKGSSTARYSRLRGAIIERLVIAALTPQYGQYELVDNAHVLLSNGISYRSDVEVDVAGWNGALGECHNCKVRADSLNAKHLDGVRDLEQNLPAATFKIGIVTAMSEMVARAMLAVAGYKPAPQTQLIFLENLWDLAPLQGTAM